MNNKVDRYGLYALTVLWVLLTLTQLIGLPSLVKSTAWFFQALVDGRVTLLGPRSIVEAMNLNVLVPLSFLINVAACFGLVKRMNWSRRLVPAAWVYFALITFLKMYVSGHLTPLHLIIWCLAFVLPAIGLIRFLRKTSIDIYFK